MLAEDFFGRYHHIKDGANTPELPDESLYGYYGESTGFGTAIEGSSFQNKVDYYDSEKIPFLPYTTFYQAMCDVTLIDTYNQEKSYTTKLFLPSHYEIGSNDMPSENYPVKYFFEDQTSTLSKFLQALNLTTSTSEGIGYAITRDVFLNNRNILSTWMQGCLYTKTVSIEGKFDENNTYNYLPICVLDTETFNLEYEEVTNEDDGSVKNVLKSEAQLTYLMFNCSSDNQVFNELCAFYGNSQEELNSSLIVTDVLMDELGVLGIITKSGEMTSYVAFNEELFSKKIKLLSQKIAEELFEEKDWQSPKWLKKAKELSLSSFVLEDKKVIEELLIAPAMYTNSVSSLTDSYTLIMGICSSVSFLNSKGENLFTIADPDNSDFDFFSEFSSQEGLLGFKICYKASLTLNDNLQVPESISYGVLSFSGEYTPEMVDITCLATNNALDTTPVWQDVTDAVLTDSAFIFDNQTYENGPAFNFRINLERNENCSEYEPYYITSIQGAFQ